MVLQSGGQTRTNALMLRRFAERSLEAPTAVPRRP